jgi:sugar phosphate isomerase/epimerase
MWRVGINPYGISYSVGSQGASSKRANPKPLLLDGFLKLAEELGVKGVELPPSMLNKLDEAALAKLHERVANNKWWVVISAGPPLGDVNELIKLCRVLGAVTIRVATTTFLAGARAEKLPAFREAAATAKKTLAEAAKRTAECNLSIAVENHQDFCSSELLELCEQSGPNVGVTLDCGNPLAVGEDPLMFAKHVAPRIFHVHLKDYRAHWSDDGYRLIRCPIGDGGIVLAEIAKVIEAEGKSVTASLEVGALNARHVKVLSPDWWEGYPQRPARDLAVALAAARVKRLREDEEWKTPWELEAPAEDIVAYELGQMKKSVANMKEKGWL